LDCYLRGGITKKLKQKQVVHSLAQPYAKAGGGQFGSGPGHSASRDNAPCNCSDNATGRNNTSRDGDPPSSAFPWCRPANNGSRRGLGTASAMSNITPHAVDVVNLKDNCKFVMCIWI